MIQQDVYVRALAQLQGFFSILDEAGVRCDQVVEFSLGMLDNSSPESLACEVMETYDWWDKLSEAEQVHINEQFRKEYPE